MNTITIRKLLPNFQSLSFFYYSQITHPFNHIQSLSFFYYSQITHPFNHIQSLSIFYYSQITHPFNHIQSLSIFYYSQITHPFNHIQSLSIFYYSQITHPFNHSQFGLGETGHTSSLILCKYLSSMYLCIFIFHIFFHTKLFKECKRCRSYNVLTVN